MQVLDFVGGIWSVRRRRKGNRCGILAIGSGG